VRAGRAGFDLDLVLDLDLDLDLEFLLLFLLLPGWRLLCEVLPDLGGSKRG
jgi:hypothetical protein